MHDPSRLSALSCSIVACPTLVKSTNKTTELEETPDLHLHCATRSCSRFCTNDSTGDSAADSAADFAADFAADSAADSVQVSELIVAPVFFYLETYTV